MNLINHIKLIRPPNFILTFISVIVAILISGETDIPFQIFLFASLSASLTAASGNIINDYFDIEIDKINKPHRPLADGEVSKSSALILYSVFNLVSLILAALLNLNSFLIVFSVQVILFFYSKQLKKNPLVGNITVAFLTGMVFIYAGAAINSIKFVIIPASFAFLINLIRELLKDAEDVKGDSAFGLVTAPIKFGIEKTKTIIFSLTVILILFTFQPFIFEFYRIEFFIIVMTIVNPLFIYFLKILYTDHSEKNLNRLSNLLKLNMLFGLIAIYAGR